MTAPRYFAAREESAVVVVGVVVGAAVVIEALIVCQGSRHKEQRGERV
jgi:hypothetical protein